MESKPKFRNENLAYLFGISDILQGYEDKFIDSLPIIKFENGKVAYTKKLNWSLNGENLKFIENEYVIQNDLTILSLENPVEIKPNQLVVIVGPIFYQNLVKINKLSLLSNKKIIIIQNLFRILLCTLEEYEKIALDIFDSAKQVFDQEIRKINIHHTLQNIISSVANYALILLKGNPFTLPEAYYIRMLAQFHILKDADSYRNTMEIFKLDLNKDENSIKEWVEEYLKFNNYYENRLVSINSNDETLYVTNPENLGLKKFINTISEQEWEIGYRYSGYFLGYFLLNKELGGIFLDYLNTFSKSVEEKAIKMNFENVQTRLSHRDSNNLNSLIDEVFQLEIVQSEPAFGSYERGQSGPMVAIGEVNIIDIVSHKKNKKELLSHLNYEAPISRIIKFCIENKYKLIIQPSSTIQDVIHRILKHNKEIILNYGTISDPDVIYEMLKIDRWKSIALVDHLVTPLILQKGLLYRINARYDYTQPVGYFIPDSDPLYAEVILIAINNSFYNKNTKKWNKKFNKFMKKAGIILLTKGPQFYRLNDEGEWETTKEIFPRLQIVSSLKSNL